MDFFRELKESIDKNDNLSKITDGIAEFISDLTKALQKEGIIGNETDIVTQIASTNKLSITSENEIDKVRTNVLQQYARDNWKLYFVFNKVNVEK